MIRALLLLKVNFVSSEIRPDRITQSPLRMTLRVLVQRVMAAMHMHKNNTTYLLCLCECH